MGSPFAEGRDVEGSVVEALVADSGRLSLCLLVPHKLGVDIARLAPAQKRLVH